MAGQGASPFSSAWLARQGYPLILRNAGEEANQVVWADWLFGAASTNTVINFSVASATALGYAWNVNANRTITFGPAQATALGYAFSISIGSSVEFGLGEAAALGHPWTVTFTPGTPSTPPARGGGWKRKREEWKEEKDPFREHLFAPFRGTPHLDEIPVQAPPFPSLKPAKAVRRALDIRAQPALIPTPQAIFPKPALVKPLRISPIEMDEDDEIPDEVLVMHMF